MAPHLLCPCRKQNMSPQLKRGAGVNRTRSGTGERAGRSHGKQTWREPKPMTQGSR
jgi:hypothetical protein